MLGWTLAEPNVPVTGEVNDDSISPVSTSVLSVKLLQ